MRQWPWWFGKGSADGALQVANRLDRVYRAILHQSDSRLLSTSPVLAAERSREGVHAGLQQSRGELHSVTRERG